MDPNQQPTTPPQSMPQMQQAVPSVLPQPVQNVPQSHGMRNLLLIVLLLLVVGGGSYYLGTRNITQMTSNYNAPTQAEQHQMGSTTQQATVSATPTPDPTASWKVFTNTKYAYSIKYPQGLTANEQNTYYHYVEFKDPTASGQLPAYLVSVIPATFTSKDPAAYNYMSSDWIANIANISVGQSKTMDQAASFTRLADTTVDGHKAEVIEVTAAGYKQHRVYVQANGNIYMISNYYQSASQLADFQLFLSTFKLTQ